MRELYIDCSSGVAGDMLSAALLELCPDRAGTLRALNALGIPGIEYSAESVKSYSVTGTHLTVSYRGEVEGQEARHEAHHHNGMDDILRIIDALNMDEALKSEVRAVYELIARAESTVHGCEIGHVHFHELGSMDALADISAACYVISLLDVGRITASPVCTGYGTVNCAHGVMPVPAPATALLLEGAASFAGDTEGELCTPTGAALVRHFAAAWGRMPLMTVTGIGCGMGQKDFGRLSCVRASLGESEETIVELCCNLDDMSPEDIGFAIGELLRGGAADAYYEAIGMKKNRPGILLTCLCRESCREQMVRLIFKHTTTLGIRETLCRRYVLKRREELVATPYGDVRVKLSQGYGAERRKPEFDDIARISRENDISISELRDICSR